MRILTRSADSAVFSSRCAYVAFRTESFVYCVSHQLNVAVAYLCFSFACNKVTLLSFIRLCAIMPSILSPYGERLPLFCLIRVVINNVAGPSQYCLNIVNRSACTTYELLYLTIARCVDMLCALRNCLRACFTGVCENSDFLVYAMNTASRCMYRSCRCLRYFRANIRVASC
jgi:hypothetical protein